jgi:uncharacterized protein (DUF1330 family)
MSAFVIVEIDIHNMDLYRSYTQLTPDTIAAYDGKFLVRGGETTLLEGDLQPKRMVVLEFPSVDKATAWWHSDVYAGAKKIRQKAATTKMIIVEGV